jgi:polyhydroxybutyrate depolymerase
MRVERQVHAAGPAGAEVVLLVVKGGGHTWPGHPSRERLLGPTTRDFDANEVMWQFFAAHHR